MEIFFRRNPHEINKKENNNTTITAIIATITCQANIGSGRGALNWITKKEERKLVIKNTKGTERRVVKTTVGINAPINVKRILQFRYPKTLNININSLFSLIVSELIV